MKTLLNLIIFTLIYSISGDNQAFAAAAEGDSDGRLRRTSVSAEEDIDWDNLWRKNVAENEISELDQQHLNRQMGRLKGLIPLSPEQEFNILAQLANMKPDMRERVVNKLVEEGTNTYPELYKTILNSW